MGEIALFKNPLKNRLLRLTFKTSLKFLKKADPSLKVL